MVRRLLTCIAAILCCSFAISCDKKEEDYIIENDSLIQEGMDNHADVDSIIVEHIYGNGNTYCAFTSLIRWEDSYYLAFREGGTHVSPNDYGIITILKSIDGKNWTISQKISIDKVDLRDPHLSIMPEGSLYLLCGARKKTARNAYITTTLCSIGENGIFESLTDIKTSFDINECTSFWIWRIEWFGNSGYGTAYAKGKDGINHALLVSTHNGIVFDFVSMMDIGSSPSECRARILKDGTLVAIMRNDYTKSRGGFIGKSQPPYTYWEWKETNIPFAGQDFVILNDKLFVVTRTKTVGAEKTGLLLVDLNGYIYWQYFLPSYGSKGDTAYGSICINDEDYWVSYYSMHETSKPGIYLAKIPTTFIPFSSYK